MTQEVEGPALTGIRPAYGLSGVDPSQQVILDDGNISQVLGTNRFARRDVEIFPGNYFHGIFENIHSVAGQQSSFLDPYAPNNPHNNFPPEVGPEFDLYLLGLSAITSLDTATSFITFNMDVREVNAAFSDLNTGGPAGIANRAFPLVGWSEFTLFPEVGRDLAALSAETPLLYQPMRIRWPRGGCQLIMVSLVTAAANIRGVAWFGGFPRALGQDVGF